MSPHIPPRTDPDDDIAIPAGDVRERFPDSVSVSPSRPEGNASGPLHRTCTRSTLSVSIRFALAVAGAILLGLLIRSGIRAHEKNTSLWSRAEALSAECLRLEARRADLSRESYALERDPFYVEKRMRQDWRQLREGEIVLDRPRSR